MTAKVDDDGKLKALFIEAINDKRCYVIHIPRTVKREIEKKTKFGNREIVTQEFYLVDTVCVIKAKSRVGIGVTYQSKSENYNRRKGNTRAFESAMESLMEGGQNTSNLPMSMYKAYVNNFPPSLNNAMISFSSEMEPKEYLLNRFDKIANIITRK